MIPHYFDKKKNKWDLIILFFIPQTIFVLTQMLVYKDIKSIGIKPMDIKISLLTFLGSFSLFLYQVRNKWFYGCLFTSITSIVSLYIFFTIWKKYLSYSQFGN
jgi:hypothetical protein